MSNLLDTAKILEIRVKRYKRQLKIGCSKHPCTNPYCRNYPSRENTNLNSVDDEAESLKNERNFCPLKDLIPCNIDYQTFAEFAEYCQEERSNEAIIEIVARCFSDLNNVIHVFEDIKNPPTSNHLHRLTNEDDSSYIPSSASIDPSPPSSPFVHNIPLHSSPMSSSVSSPASSTLCSLPLPFWKTINPTTIVNVYQTIFLLDDPKLTNTLVSSTKQLVRQLLEIRSLIQASSQTLALFPILLLSHVVADFTNNDILVNVCMVLCELEMETQATLIRWLASFEPSILRRMIGPMQTYVSLTLLITGFRITPSQGRAGNRRTGTDEPGGGSGNSRTSGSNSSSGAGDAAGEEQESENGKDQLATPKQRRSMEVIVGAMRVMFRATLQQRQSRLDERGMMCDAFYNEVVNERKMGDEYVLMKEGKFSFCNSPFLLTASSKATILRFEAQHQQEREVRGQFLSSLLRGSNVLSCTLKVRRDHLIEDTLNEIEGKTASELRKPLKIVFVNEEAIDEGGVRKEFFVLLMRELFDLKYGIVVDVNALDGDDDSSTESPSSSSTPSASASASASSSTSPSSSSTPSSSSSSSDTSTQSPSPSPSPSSSPISSSNSSSFYWFNPFYQDDQGTLELVGKMLGLAIYNSTILDLHFPLVVYKKLLNIPPTLADLAQIQPELAHSFQMMLQMPPDEVESLCQTFSVVRRVFGEIRTIDLCRDGRNKDVTGENREEYICCYINWYFNTSVKHNFDAFAKGFSAIVGDLIHMFQPEELELLIVGSRELDFEALEKNAQYDGGFSSEHPTIKLFWKVVHTLSEDEKRLLLHFVTSTDRAPIGGLGKMKFVVVRNGPDSDQLPTSHTCFNALMLPEYQSAEKMKEKLLTAIRNAEGFGLK